MRSAGRAPGPSRQVRRSIATLIVLGLLGAVLVHTSFRSSSRVLTASELMVQAPGDASIQVRGLVAPGSVRRRGAWLVFEIADRAAAARVSVHYEGPVPDAFRAGRMATVTGTYGGGVLTAQPNTLRVRCAGAGEDDHC
jgi:cytochrome c-type biogenesis protein CcmE